MHLEIFLSPKGPWGEHTDGYIQNGLEPCTKQYYLEFPTFLTAKEISSLFSPFI